MKYIIIIVAAFIVLGALLFAINSFIYTEQQADIALDSANVQTDRYTLSEEGLAFNYPAGANGYTVLEMPGAQNDPTPIRAIRLVPTSDYQDEQSRVGGEGSPSWMLTIFANDQKLQPAQWVTALPNVSNLPLAMGEPAEAVVGGANAVTYRTDGLYPTQVYVIAHDNRIYMVQVSFMDEQDRTFVEHQAWINSFEFIPVKPTQMSGKLDPKFVCEGALAYMSFDSNEAAEAFVTACINGEHPEVFERYLKDQGLDGAVI